MRRPDMFSCLGWGAIQYWGGRISVRNLLCSVFGSASLVSLYDVFNLRNTLCRGCYDYLPSDAHLYIWNKFSPTVLSV